MHNTTFVHKIFYIVKFEIRYIPFLGTVVSFIFSTFVRATAVRFTFLLLVCFVCGKDFQGETNHTTLTVTTTRNNEYRNLRFYKAPYLFV